MAAFCQLGAVDGPATVPVKNALTTGGGSRPSMSLRPVPLRHSQRLQSKKPLILGR